jgi:cell division protein FtsN
VHRLARGGAAASADYGVQVASYPERAEAEAAVTRLAALGGPPLQVFRADLGPRGVWHRVIVVGFPDASAAQAHRARLRTEGREPGPILRIERGR